MNVAKSKFQQIVQEELQRLIYEQTGYSGQGEQQVAAVKKKQAKGKVKKIYNEIKKVLATKPFNKIEFKHVKRNKNKRCIRRNTDTIRLI